MARRYYSSAAQRTTLTSSITNTATTMVVGATSGFPSSFPYSLLVDPDTVNEEVVTVTGAAGTTLTVTRGSDGTTGVAHSAGAVVQHGVSARDFDEPNAHVNTGAAVHGIVGSVVGTTDVQTLTNKSMDGASNTFTNIPQTSVVGLSGSYAPLNLTFNTLSGTTYTLVLSDASKQLDMGNAANITLTVPPNSSVAFPVGTTILVCQTAAGQVTVTPGAGVTINGTPGLKTRAQWSVLSLTKRATDTWLVSGDVSA